MFTEITVNNFKLFKDNVVFGNLRPINLLTGVNGRGKSTFLQLLLLPKQAILTNRQTLDLLLDGEYVQLGNAVDVKNVNTRREEPITITYKETESKATFSYKVNEANSQVLEFESLMIELQNRNAVTRVKTMEALSRENELSFHKIQYVSADRKGPELNYPISERRDFIGAKGEFVVSQIYNYRDDAVSEDYIDELVDLFPELVKEDVSTNFVNQIEFWMSKMFKGTRIGVNYIDDANVLTLKISTVQHVNDRFKPTNVGFGYTYILPIVVAGLTAQPGDVLVFENPEAHLHPSAQAMIGRFMTLISNLGVQVFVESHSEHILNSFRVCIKQGHLDHNRINVMFFGDDNEEFYKPVIIDEHGKIDSWPKYFYDQEEQDIDIIMVHPTFRVID